MECRQKNSTITYVQVLYTGGTIGMVASPHGLIPGAGFFERSHQAALQRQEQALPAWQVEELDPLIDSANLVPALWPRLAKKAWHAYKQGAAAILILHGTDTLSYSAAAMGFWLKQLPIPAMITGAMWPASQPLGDAWDNFFGALRTVINIPLGQFDIFFHQHRIYGFACFKERSQGWHPFRELFPRSCFMTTAMPLPAVNVFEPPVCPPNIVILTIYPGMNTEAIVNAIEKANAILIEGYGSGTFPTNDPVLFKALEKAKTRQVLILIISQCLYGGVALDVYAVSNGLVQLGVIAGGLMTRSTAYAKLYWLLCQPDLDYQQRQTLLSMNLFGEMG